MCLLVNMPFTKKFKKPFIKNLPLDRLKCQNPFQRLADFGDFFGKLFFVLTYFSIYSALYILVFLLHRNLY
jgi:hypothetical protein